MKIIVLLLMGIALIMTSPFSVQAQFGFEYDDTIVVKVGSDTLIDAWAGGLNYSQFSDFDFDFDGDLDLFVFDRSSNNIRVFTQEDNGGKHYELAYNAQQYFPVDMRYRATMVDYDNDGRKDLFTYGIGGLKVYRNIGDLSNGLQWELYQELVNSQYPGIYTNLYISSTDIPAIIDVDADGDVDVLTFSQSGKHVEYHQNQSMDLYGIPDSLIFELKNECWGKFSEDVNNSSILLNDSDAPCVGGSIPIPEFQENYREKEVNEHSGSTLLALDYDNSGVMDLVIGDVSYTGLSLLINGGSAVNTDSPMISVDYSFPSNTTPANIQLFPAAYYVDVDFDNVKDLLVCPNAKNVSENETSVHYYKNTGSNSNPNFILSSNNFLQSEMLEHGTGSIPVFFDYDEDGLQDLFIANFYRYKPVLDKESTIAYYKNTGSPTTPVFTYVDFDFLNLALENFGLRSVPAFGDIDNDGDDDLFLGIEDGTLVYYENNSIGTGAMFGSPIINYQDNLGVTISVSSYCHPQLYDLNNDGLLDLILGKRSGELVYYQNIGTASTPSFELLNPMLGNVDVSSTSPDGYSAPHFFKSGGQTILFIGSIDGELIYFTDIETNLGQSDSFNLNSTSYLGIDVQAYSSFWVNDINNDGSFDLFVGQDLGGLYHFEANPNSDAAVTENNINLDILIYPNPSSESINLVFVNNAKGVQYSIMDLRGEIISNDKLFSMKEVINISSWPIGFYIIQVELENGLTITKKIVKN